MEMESVTTKISALTHCCTDTRSSILYQVIEPPDNWAVSPGIYPCCTMFIRVQNEVSSGIYKVPCILKANILDNLFNMARLHQMYCRVCYDFLFFDSYKIQSISFILYLKYSDSS